MLRLDREPRAASRVAVRAFVTKSSLIAGNPYRTVTRWHERSPRRPSSSPDQPCNHEIIESTILFSPTHPIALSTNRLCRCAIRCTFTTRPRSLEHVRLRLSYVRTILNSRATLRFSCAIPLASCQLPDRRWHQTTRSLNSHLMFMSPTSA